MNASTCCYGCNTPIYWNPVKGEYWEVLAQKKNVCPNRTNSNVLATSNNTTKPSFYSKKLEFKAENV